MRIPGQLYRMFIKAINLRNSSIMICIFKWKTHNRVINGLCSNDQQWIEKNVTDFHNKQLTESYCKWCTDRTHITWFLNDKFLLINGFKFAAVLFMIFFGQRQFLWFCFCVPTQWILNQAIEMWLECRFSALIRGVLHKYHINCLGYILFFLFTVPHFHRLKIHWTPWHDFNYKDSFLYLHEKPL